MHAVIIKVDEFEANIVTKLKEEFKNLQLNNPEPEKLLTRKQAATFLNVTLVTLNEWTKLGLITSGRIGRRVYYKKSDLISATQIDKS